MANLNDVSRVLDEHDHESFLIRCRTLFEAFVIFAIQVMLTIVIALAVFELGLLLYQGAYTQKFAFTAAKS